jgi:hypothetical protein
MNKKFWIIFGVLLIVTTAWFTYAYLNSHDQERYTLTDIELDRAEWGQILDWPDVCNEYLNYSYLVDNGITEYKINDDELIILVDCFQAAYQTSYRIYHYNSNLGEARELALGLYGPNGENLVNTGGFAGFVNEYFAETGELVFMSRSAGHGGCGYEVSYIWDSSLKEYKLVSENANFDCDSPIPSADWQQIFPVKTLD